MRKLSRLNIANSTAQKRPDVLNRVFARGLVQPYPGRGQRGLPHAAGVLKRPGRGAAWPLIHHTRRFSDVRFPTVWSAIAPNFVEVAGRLNASTDAATTDTSLTTTRKLSNPRAMTSFTSTTRAAFAAESEAESGLGEGPPQQGVVHYAVVGAGLAGVATAWQLMRRSPKGRPVVLDLYDAAGIAAGGSGAAAGLLHPYSPRGKLLWRGEEAMAAALELVAAAEKAVGTRPHDAAATATVTAAGGQLRLEPKSGLPPLQPSPPPSGGLGSGIMEAGQLCGVEVPVSAASSTAGSDLQGGRFMWPYGLVRPAATQRQAADFVKALGAPEAPDDSLVVDGSGSSADSRSSVRLLSVTDIHALVPGLVVPSFGAAREGGEGGGAAERSENGQVGEGNRRARRAARAAAAAARGVTSDVAGMYIPQGRVLDVGQYLRALWRACQVEAEARSDGSSARLMYERVSSLERLRWAAPMGETPRVEGKRAAPPPPPQQQQQPAGLNNGGVEYGQYNAIVVAAGAAAATIEEVNQARLPLELCQGVTLVMRPPPPPHDRTAVSGPTGAPEPSSNPLQAVPGAPEWASSETYPPGIPSLLGQPYIAAQGPTRLVVGATKSYGWTSEAALAACQRSEYAGAAGLSRIGAGRRSDAFDEADAGGASPLGAQAAFAGSEDQEEAVAGLQAAACRVWTPLNRWRIGSVREGVRALPPRTTHGSLPLLGRLAAGRPWWLVAGLGSRGLVYHGWLAGLIADAVLYDREDGIPQELTAWREVAAGSAVFETP